MWVYMDRLVKMLCKGEHLILLEPRIKDYSEIKDRLQKMKFVFIKFVDTIGETELGINVDDNLTNFKDANFDNKNGNLYIVGTCKLNYQNVRVTGNVNLANKKGRAKLEII